MHTPRERRRSIPTRRCCSISRRGWTSTSSCARRPTTARRHSRRPTMPRRFEGAAGAGRADRRREDAGEAGRHFHAGNRSAVPEAAAARGEGHGHKTRSRTTSRASSRSRSTDRIRQGAAGDVAAERARGAAAAAEGHRVPLRRQAPDSARRARQPDHRLHAERHPMTRKDRPCIRVESSIVCRCAARSPAAGRAAAQDITLPNQARLAEVRHHRRQRHRLVVAVQASPSS